jgi:AraC family transcriptional regulator, regulatory protein of adaptative response / methylated-DNA-[protein]-cysteine methyltransferase
MTDTSTMTKKMPSEDDMRRALAERNPGCDGRFVYGVVTTGVYCRPSCSSRPAKPQNVCFFADPAAAESAGLRECKRCRPRAFQDRAARVIESVAEYIEQHAHERLTLAHLAKGAHLSPAHLQRKFKALLGVSPKMYHDAARLRRLKGGLRAGKSIVDAIIDAGFESTSRVYGHAPRSLGMTPTAYRRGGAGESIAYAARDTMMGPLLMAATDRGLCFAQFGDSAEALIAQLKCEFPNAMHTPSRMAGSGELDAWMQAFADHIAGNSPRPELPLDLRGTAFQIRVWRFLLGVPEGSLMSYSELAAGIGAPKAVRAAASACAANRIAVLVPCHRVLRGDGTLGGYRWGLERKRVLIDGERRRHASV